MCDGPGDGARQLAHDAAGLFQDDLMDPIRSARSLDRVESHGLLAEFVRVDGNRGYSCHRNLRYGGNTLGIRSADVDLEVLWQANGAGADYMADRGFLGAATVLLQLRFRKTHENHVADQCRNLDLGPGDGSQVRRSYLDLGCAGV